MPVPLLIGASVVGTGLQVAGAFGQASANQKIAKDEQAVEAQRQQAMELDAKRKQLEAVRNAQRARSVALTNATSQGAQYGTATAGAYGQISGQTGVNLLGIDQNLQIGRNEFGINSDITQQRISSSQYGTLSSAGQGLSSLSSSFMKGMPEFDKLSQGGFGSLFGNTGSNSMNSYGGAVKGLGTGGLI